MAKHEIKKGVNLTKMTQVSPMIKCEIKEGLNSKKMAQCPQVAKYIIKVKKSETDDRAYRVCQRHRDAIDRGCRENGWEFKEIN